MKKSADHLAGPPTHYTDEAKALWIDVVAGWSVDRVALRLVAVACESLMRIREAQKVLAREETPDHGSVRPTESSPARAGGAGLDGDDDGRLEGPESRSRAAARRDWQAAVAWRGDLTSGLETPATPARRPRGSSAGPHRIFRDGGLRGRAHAARGTVFAVGHRVDVQPGRARPALGTAPGSIARRLARRRDFAARRGRSGSTTATNRRRRSRFRRPIAPIAGVHPAGINAEDEEGTDANE